jgi:translin
MTSLKNVLRQIKTELREKDKIREKAQEDMRKTTSLSKQSILLIHQKRNKEAAKLLAKARETISKLRNTSGQYPEIIYSGLFGAALQEYSEANIFLTLIEKSRFITPQEIDVPSIDYILGLADVIGEYRRYALDALREGNTKRSEKCLQTMDNIYTELMAMDEAYMLIPGLRRKCDIARKIIETTRGDVTQEVRRSALEKYLKRFESLQKKKQASRKVQ